MRRVALAVLLALVAVVGMAVAANADSRPIIIESAQVVR